MAVLKIQENIKQEDGSYAVAHKETEAGLVLFDDGDTFQQKFNAGELKGATGPTGADGVTPNIQVGTVTTLEAGSKATVVRRSGSPNAAPVLDFGIPKGADATSSHTHAASDITSGTISTARLPVMTVSKGGTGKTMLISGSYLVGNGTSEVTQKTPAQVLADIGAVPATGGDVTGIIDMNNKIITGLPDPIAPSDAVNYATLLRVLSGNAVVLGYTVTSANYSGNSNEGQIIVARVQSPQANAFRFVFDNQKFQANFTPVASDDQTANVNIIFPGCTIVGEWSAPDLCTLTVNGGNLFVLPDGDNVCLSIRGVPRGNTVILDGYLTLGVN